MTVTDGVSLTPTREVLEAMVDSVRQPRHSVPGAGLRSMGVRSTGAGNRESVWLACDADEDLIFDDDHDSKWTRALAKIGVRAGHAVGPGRPGVRRRASKRYYSPGRTMPNKRWSRQTPLIFR